MQKNGEIILGVLHFPKLRETFTAIKGAGAFKNDVPLYVSDCKSLDQAVIAEILSFKFLGHSIQLPRCMGLRQYGMPTYPMALVSQGLLHGAIAKGKLWDVAAGEPILSEAGGKVTRKECASGRMTSVVSGEGLHEELCHFAFDVMSEPR